MKTVLFAICAAALISVAPVAQAQGSGDRDDFLAVKPGSLSPAAIAAIIAALAAAAAGGGSGSQTTN